MFLKTTTKAIAIAGIFIGIIGDEREAMRAAADFVEYGDIAVKGPEGINVYVRAHRAGGYEVKVNWAGCGSQSVDDARRYADAIAESCIIARRIEASIPAVMALADGADREEIANDIRVIMLRSKR